MDIFKQFATDETRENNGTWVAFNGSKFLIARTGNRNYGKVLSAAVDTNKLLLDQKGDEADKLSQDIMIDVLATTILLDWENVQYKGKKLPYSVANAKVLLSHKDFRQLVSKWADDIDHFRQVQTDEQAKN